MQELATVYQASQEPYVWDESLFHIYVFVQRLIGYDSGFLSPHLESVKEQLRGIESKAGRRDVRRALLHELERHYNPDNNIGREGEVLSAYCYVQKQLVIEEHAWTMLDVREILRT